MANTDDREILLGQINKITKEEVAQLAAFAISLINVDCTTDEITL